MAWKEYKGKDHLSPEQRAKVNTYLRPLGDKTDKRSQAIRKKAQAAANVAKKQKRALRAIMNDVLTLKATDADITALDDIAREYLQKICSVDNEEADTYTAMCVAMLAKAMRGDVDAARWVRDSAGDKPTEKTQVEASVVTPADVEMMHAVSARLGLDAEKSKESG